MTKRAVLPLLAVAVAACARPTTGPSYGDRVAEILVRLDGVHARTIRACERPDAQCIVAAESGTVALRRMRSDLVALRAPPGLVIAKRDLLRALDHYAEANEALAAATLGGDRDACLRGVTQAKRSVDGAAAVPAGIAIRSPLAPRTPAR